MQNAILKYIYNHFLEKDSPICYMPYNQINPDTLAVKAALKELEANGIIETSRPGIGAIYICITDYGLSLCEQNL